MFRSLPSPGILEIFLFQLIVYAVIWLTNEYLASLISFIIVPILIAVLLISLIADQIEKSNVPRKYYGFLLVSILAPILVYGFFIWIYEGVLDWID